MYSYIHGAQFSFHRSIRLIADVNSQISVYVWRMTPRMTSNFHLSVVHIFYTSHPLWWLWFESTFFILWTEHTHTHTHFQCVVITLSSFPKDIFCIVWNEITRFRQRREQQQQQRYKNNKKYAHTHTHTITISLHSISLLSLHRFRVVGSLSFSIFSSAFPSIRKFAKS